MPENGKSPTEQDVPKTVKVQPWKGLDLWPEDSEIDEEKSRTITLQKMLSWAVRGITIEAYKATVNIEIR
jgi:hypothetical protein